MGIISNMENKFKKVQEKINDFENKRLEKLEDQARKSKEERQKLLRKQKAIAEIEKTKKLKEKIENKPRKSTKNPLDLDIKF